MKPLVERILNDRGKSSAKIIVLADPAAQGFEHACGLLPDICERYAHFDLLLFLIDNDGKGRLPSLRHHESRHGPRLICCAAIEEVEVWLLSGHLEKIDRRWPEIRADVSVKENIFEPFLREYGDPRRPGGGRDQLMKQTLANYPGLLERCPELKELRDRVCASLAAQN